MNKIIFLLVFLVSISSFPRDIELEDKNFDNFQDLAMAWEKEIKADEVEISKAKPRITDSATTSNYRFSSRGKKIKKLISDVRIIVKHEIKQDTSSIFESSIKEFFRGFKRIKKMRRSMVFNNKQIKQMITLSQDNDLNGLQMAILPYLGMHIVWIDETRFVPIEPKKYKELN